MPIPSVMPTLAGTLTSYWAKIKFLLESYATDNAINEMDAEMSQSTEPQTWCWRNAQRLCQTRNSSVTSRMMRTSCRAYLLKHYTDQFNIACPHTAVQERPVMLMTLRVKKRCWQTCRIDCGWHRLEILLANQAAIRESKTTKDRRESLQ